MGFKDIINKEKLQFKDRETFIHDIKAYYQHMKNEKPFFQIVSISGMGGTGKTRLLNELISILKETYKDDSNQVILNITLEISGSDDFLNALTKLRAQIGKVCPLFDYAFLVYWKQTQITKLDNSFMNVFTCQWGDAAKWIASMFSITFKWASVSFDTILEFLEKVFGLLREKYYASFFEKHSKDIAEYTAEELKECLAGFLGMDMNRLFCEKNLCVFVDAYERYPSSHYVDWLMDLIEQTYTGLFIISGRETISFPEEIKKYVAPELLDSLPEVSVHELLNNYLPNVNDAVIQHIIKITDRLPIYLDLAIGTYRNLRTSGEIFDQNIFFMYKDKEELTKAFFSHLKPSHQNFLLTLSFLQLFDQELFFYITTLCPDSCITDYHDYQLLSIISKVENDHDFFKVHDVLNTNVIAIIDYDTRLFLFNKYLEHIVSKTLFYATDTQKIILYKHILNMIIKNNFVLQQKDTELVLDLFFSLKQTLQTLLPTGILEIDTYESLREINYFTKAISNEREDTLTRLEYLKHIDFENNKLGKHQKSLNIIYGFLTQWTGNGQPLVDYLSMAYPQLDDTEIREWYYAQTVIFWADHLTIIGEFETAKQILCDFREKLQQFPEQENSIFQATRHMGHIFRFNMFLEDANREYFSTINETGHFKNVFQEIYIVTNICETNCYLNPDMIYQYCYRGLRLGKNLKDLKSLAKIYYSMGIAAIHKKKYKRVKKYIRKSMFLNTEDGYKLGVLSSMLANIYLQFAIGKPIRSQAFENLLSDVNVYGFQALPLSLIKGDNDQIQAIGKQYEWLDYPTTIQTFKKFLATIRSESLDNHLTF